MVEKISGMERGATAFIGCDGHKVWQGMIRRRERVHYIDIISYLNSPPKQYSELLAFPEMCM